MDKQKYKRRVMLKARATNGMLSRNAPYPSNIYQAGIYPGRWAYPETVPIVWPLTADSSQLHNNHSKMTQGQFNENQEENAVYNAQFPLGVEPWVSGCDEGPMDCFSLSDEFAFSNETTLGYDTAKLNNGQASRRMALDKNLVSPFSSDSHDSLNWGADENHNTYNLRNQKSRQSLVFVSGNNSSIASNLDSCPRWLENSPLPTNPSQSALNQSFDYFKSSESGSIIQCVRPDQIFPQVPYKCKINDADISTRNVQNDSNDNIHLGSNFESTILEDCSFGGLNDAQTQLTQSDQSIKDSVSRWVTTLNTPGIEIPLQSPLPGVNLELNIAVVCSRTIQRSYESERRWSIII